MKPEEKKFKDQSKHIIIQKCVKYLKKIVYNLNKSDWPINEALVCILVKQDNFGLLHKNAPQPSLQGQIERFILESTFLLIININFAHRNFFCAIIRKIGSIL